MATLYQVDAVTELLIEKKLITEQEFFSRLTAVQKEWQSKRGMQV
jgi:hypothetical protein